MKTPGRGMVRIASYHGNNNNTVTYLHETLELNVQGGLTFNLMYCYHGERDRQGDRQSDRQTDRQTDRQADRQIEIDRQTEKE